MCLHVGGATGHCGDDTLDGGRVQLHQGQHVRGDPEGRAQPAAALAVEQFQEPGLVLHQAVPEPVVQRLVIALDEQVLLFPLKTDRQGRKHCHQFAELHLVTCLRIRKRLKRTSLFQMQPFTGAPLPGRATSAAARHRAGLSRRCAKSTRDSEPARLAGSSQTLKHPPQRG